MLVIIYIITMCLPMYILPPPSSLDASLDMMVVSFIPSSPSLVSDSPLNLMDFSFTPSPPPASVDIFRASSSSYRGCSFYTSIT